MKKNFLFMLSVSLLVLTNSCSTGSDTPNVIDGAQVDAAATAAAYHNSNDAFVISATIAAMQGSMASSLYILNEGGNRISTLSSGNSNGNLSQSHKLAFNSFENIGIDHNNFLNVLATNGGLDSAQQRLLAYDFNFYDKFFNASSLSELHSLQTKLEVFNRYKDNNLAQAFINKASIIATSSNSSNIIDFISLPTQEANELKNINSQYLVLRNNNASTDDISIYLNIEITKIYNNFEVLNKAQETQVVYLTTLKHSNYYWNN